MDGFLALVLLTVITLLCLAWMVRHAEEAGNRPISSDGQRFPVIPSPWAWPVVGNLPNLYWAGYKPEKLMMKWAKKFGEIYSFQLGYQRVVVLNTYKLIKEAWHHPQLQDRAAPLVYIKALGFGEGVTYANGKEWKNMRSFVLNMFRKLGVGKEEFETVIFAEADRILQGIEWQGRVLDVSLLFSMASCNIISKVIFSQQLEYTDPRFQEEVRTVLRHFQLAGPGSLNSIVPIFAHIKIGPGQRIVNNYKGMKRLWSRHIQKHLKKNDSSSSALQHEDIVDAYLAELQAHLKDGTKSQFKMENLLWLLRDLYIAGTETTATTLRWAILYLALNPEKQLKCHEELELALNSVENVLRYSERAKVPYINAFLMESLRLGDILPLGLPHLAAEDTVVCGYFIPKGSVVMSNMRATSLDPGVSPEPDVFKPERFLTGDGKYENKEEMKPFGTGKRICLGEQLARIELFIWFTRIMQRYEVRLAGGTVPDVTATRTSLVRYPPNFEVEFVERAENSLISSI